MVYGFLMGFLTGAAWIDFLATWKKAPGTISISGMSFGVTACIMALGWVFHFNNL